MPSTIVVMNNLAANGLKTHTIVVSFARMEVVNQELQITAPKKGAASYTVGIGRNFPPEKA
jgi:hypothetical protein